MSLRQEKEKGVNVQVLLRCRPFSDDELRSNAPQVVTCNDLQREVAISQSIAGKHVDRIFTFDKVFGPSAQQRDLYEQAVIPIVNEVLEGFNCTIFAYGQTGTGKTYTMEGECKKAKSGPNGELPSEAGVIPRAVKQIFDTLEGQNAEYSVKVTFLELYNEEITDLLAPDELPRVPLDDKQKKQLPLMEDGKGGVLVRGLEEEIVNSASEIFYLLEKGSSKRRTAETLLNKQSSRSHSLFSITIHIKEPTPEGEELIKCGKLNLVDLAGSENISRSGAREGRAREAGEINKSLLTLGRVINALVEHLGHIPYRDSKLTRLLRDSLGGRTKTCIIATVSPAVHCLEETLSTLDYAHRAKHIKNKPEVNQKMMKSTLIKDLYCEIERLKGEVYAAREKNGIYIPKERYIQEENERKAMSDQVEQFSTYVETYQKQLEESQVRYNSQMKKIASLSNKLDGTEKNLSETKKNMERTEEDLRRCHYTLKERDYIISEQRKSENRLVHQASVLRSDLEKCLKDNDLLFSKLAREDKLNADNRSVVTEFQSELSQQIDGLCNKVSISAARQNENLRYIEKQCDSFLNSHEKVIVDLRKKVSTSRVLFMSHVEDIQNVARLHKASFDAGLDEISLAASSNSSSIEEFLASESRNADTIFVDLQNSLSSHQEEMALFSRELRQRFHSSTEQTREVSEYMDGVFYKILEESGKLKNHCSETRKDHSENIMEFQKAFEEQNKSDTEKFISEMTSLASNLASSYSRRQQELVDKRLVGLREDFIGKMMFFDESVSSVSNVTSDAKRKWNEFSKQTETDANDGVNFSASKHCKMELLFQDCTSTLEKAQDQCKTTHSYLREMSGRHVEAMSSLIRNAVESNTEHEAEISSACINVQKDMKKSNSDIFHHFDGISIKVKESVSGILQVVKEDDTALEALRIDHSGEAASIMDTARDTFCNRYMDYEESGGTPGRCEEEEKERVPSEESIELLRAKPMEHLVDEFRENNMSFHVSVVTKESHPVLLNRPPLTEVNN